MLATIVVGIVCLFVGAFLGLLVAGLYQAAKRGDKTMEEASEPEDDLPERHNRP